MFENMTAGRRGPSLHGGRLWRRIAAGSVVVALAAGACTTGGQSPVPGSPTPVPGGSTDGSTPAPEAGRIVYIESNVAVAVAIGEGLYEGVDVEIVAAGSSSPEALFVAGQGDMTGMSPVTVAEYASQGEEFVFLTTAGSVNMLNGVAVRAEDATTYPDIKALVGKKLGIPGLATDTWVSFRAYMSSLGIDAENDFELVTASPGALLGLLAAGEVDGAILYSGPTVSAMAEADKYKVIFGFSEGWQEETGEPLVVAAPVVRASWLAENAHLVRPFIEGTDRGVEWMMEHPDEFREGGKYEDLAKLRGWLSGSPAATDANLKLLSEGEYYLTSDSYTESFINASYEFVEMALGSELEQLPEKGQIFGPPLEQ